MYNNACRRPGVDQVPARYPKHVEMVNPQQQIRPGSPNYTRITYIAMNTIQKPYAESCDQNSVPILEVIEPVLRDHSRLLEIGSGTGQHAVFFASRLPGILWQTSDRAEGHAGIKMWLDDDNPGNVLEPFELDVCNETHWPDPSVTPLYDSVFTANTLHIRGDADVGCMFEGLGCVTGQGADLLIYGPFNYDGQYTSDSNRRFDQWLKDRDPLSGIKHFEMVCKLAGQNGFVLQHDYTMPANNRILHFSKLR